MGIFVLLYKMINIESFNDYEDINQLAITFIGTPKKNLETDVYSVLLKDPLIFKLPKSKLLEIKEDDNGVLKAIYALRDPALIHFFDNLDANIVNLSNRYSLKWFGKDIPQMKLMNYYKNIYNIENNVRNLHLTLDSDADYDELLNYNIDDDQNIVIRIAEMYIYKDAMRLNLNFDSCAYDSTSADSNDDLKNMLNSSPPLCETYMINSDRSVCETNIVNSDRQACETYMDNIENSDEDSVSDADTETAALDTTDINCKVEMLNLIKAKERIRNKLLSNTSRINSAKKDLVAQTDGIDKELDMFRTQLENM